MGPGRWVIGNLRFDRSFNYWEPGSVYVQLQSGGRYVSQPPYLALRPTAFVLLVALGIAKVTSYEVDITLWPFYP